MFPATVLVGPPYLLQAGLPFGMVPPEAPGDKGEEEDKGGLHLLHKPIDGLLHRLRRDPGQADRGENPSRGKASLQEITVAVDLSLKHLGTVVLPGKVLRAYSVDIDGDLLQIGLSHYLAAHLGGKRDAAGEEGAPDPLLGGIV